MKKIGFALAILAMLVFAGTAFAVEGTLEGEATVEDSIDVSAYVEEYGAVTEAEDLALIIAWNIGNGGQYEASIDDPGASFTVESNCNITLTLTDNNLNNAIDTTYTFENGEEEIVSDGGTPGKQEACLEVTYAATEVVVNEEGNDGNDDILDLAAGNYNDGTVTLTIAAD